MDFHSKTGTVYLQPHKAGKKWKPVWLSLFPQSSSGVGRLEIQDMGGVGGDHGAAVRRHQHHSDKKLKVVRLSELLSVVRLPPNAEACPMDNMSAFCVETQNRTMVFAALKDECVDWVEKLCHCTFQQGSNQLHMEENQIYASADEASDFWVVVQKTDAATRCGLQGSYWLQVGRKSLLLKDTQKNNIVREWPYELLRRYGNDKLALTIEAGRRCDSGPGSFTFETLQAEKIFSMIQSTIKEKTSSVTVSGQDQEAEKVNNIQAHSPLPRTPDLAATLDNKMKMQEKKSAAGEESVQAPITLMPLPLIPSHDIPHLGGLSEAVYADPADCIQAAPKLQQHKSLYVDPASVLPLQPPSSRSTPPPNADSQRFIDAGHPDSVYSEVYDKVIPCSAVPVKEAVPPTADTEPVYAEPIGSEKEVVPCKKETDPFAHLYAQVRKTPPSSAPSSSSHAAPPCSSAAASATVSIGSSKSSDQPLDDVIYENLGII